MGLEGAYLWVGVGTPLDDAGLLVQVQCSCCRSVWELIELARLG